jgi:hypothetical protein
MVVVVIVMFLAAAAASGKILPRRHRVCDEKC